jgi:hypothetical protein
MGKTTAAAGGERPRTLHAQLRMGDAGRIERLARADLETELDYLRLHLEGLELAVRGLDDEGGNPRSLMPLVQSAQDRCAGILAAIGAAGASVAGAP